MWGPYDRDTSLEDLINVDQLEKFLDSLQAFVIAELETWKRLLEATIEPRIAPVTKLMVLYGRAVESRRPAGKHGNHRGEAPTLLRKPVRRRLANHAA